jgi:xylulose-5-phosphate/fructose-6-phosphate phosphoketolase
MDAAIAHCSAGIGIWAWASSGATPDLVMACAGDVPTLETLAATAFLRRRFPALGIRVVNVVDLMTLQSQEQHPHGLSDSAFDALFTTDRPVIFAYHGYPALIHRLAYRRRNHDNFHVHGYREEGSTTTPFDMVVRNRIDRFHLALAAIDRLPELGGSATQVREEISNTLAAHRSHIARHGTDLPEVAGWRWSALPS